MSDKTELPKWLSEAMFERLYRSTRAHQRSRVDELSSNISDVDGKIAKYNDKLSKLYEKRQALQEEIQVARRDLDNGPRTGMPPAGPSQGLHNLSAERQRVSHPANGGGGGRGREWWDFQSPGHARGSLFIDTLVRDPQPFIDIRKNIGLSSKEYTPHITLFDAIVRHDKTSSSYRTLQRMDFVPRVHKIVSDFLSDVPPIYHATDIEIMGGRWNADRTKQTHRSCVMTFNDRPELQQKIHTLRNSIIYLLKPNPRFSVTLEEQELSRLVGMASDDQERKELREQISRLVVPLGGSLAIRKYNLPDAPFKMHVTLFRETEVTDFDNTCRTLQRQHRTRIELQPDNAIRCTYNYQGSSLPLPLSEPEPHIAESARTNKTGALIGLQGSKIAEVRNVCQVEVKFDNSTNIVTVRGNPNKVQEAKSMIERNTGERLNWTRV